MTSQSTSTIFTVLMLFQGFSSFVLPWKSWFTIVSSLILDGTLVAVGLICMILESQNLNTDEVNSYVDWLIIIWGGSQYLVMFITGLDLAWVFRV